MPTSSDDPRIEFDLEPCPPLPQAVRLAVQTRRRAVVRRRAAAAGMVACGVLIALLWIPAAPTGSVDGRSQLRAGIPSSPSVSSRSAPPTTPTQATPGIPASAIADASMAALRRSWRADGDLPGQNNSAIRSPGPSLRLGDLDRVIGGQL